LCKNNDGKKIYIKKLRLCRDCYEKLRKENNMEICKIDGCNRKTWSFGLCGMHYMRQRRGEKDMRPERLSLKWKENDPRRFKNVGCSVDGCENKFYAKGYCRHHYHLNQYHGSPYYKKDTTKPICKVENCDRISTVKGFCGTHYERYRQGTKIDRPIGNGGKLNCQWKGGISSYPNHYELKKNRLIVLKKANWICKYCGGKADRVHHRDKTKDNHAIENLAPSCAKCNSQRMNENRRFFIRDYGISMKKISKKFKLTRNEIVFLHDNDQLKGIVSQVDFMG